MTSNSFESLGRLLANENSASDLLALLAELDERPLSTAFDLSNNRRYELRREVAAGKGRLDVVVFETDSQSPVAVVEMKGASDLHGDQLDRYIAWASNLQPQPKLFLCAFDTDEEDSNPAWTRRKLSDVFSAWTGSEHLHASWLATEVVALLESWDREANGRIGSRTGYYVPDILTKRLARDVHERLLSQLENRTHAGAYRDNAGSPMILAWAAHPRDPSDDTVVVGVDLRSPTRRSNSTKWKLRPFVQVDSTPERGLKKARILAFNLAWEIHKAMGHECLSEELSRVGHTRLADAHSVRRYDGFNRPTVDFDFEAWVEAINENARYPRTGVFFHDKGRRLATIIDLEVQDLSRDNLADLVTSIIGFLEDAGRATISR